MAYQSDGIPCLRQHEICRPDEDGSTTISTDNLRIQSTKVLLPPVFLREELPITSLASKTVHNTRQQIAAILRRLDDRVIVVVGPCSIHDVKSAREYASLLKPVLDELSDDLCIVMRVYFEKPRTTVGWKGLINDPYLDQSFKVNDGLRMARQLMLDLACMNVPVGTEFLDLITPQYLTDLVSWGSIGARTVESQVHRELVSGLSCPVGFKNGTTGSIGVAIEAIESASHPHHFLSHTKDGLSAIFGTTGNPDCHVILRGGRETGNYKADDIAYTSKALQHAGISTGIMVDCSHGNSNKNFHNQAAVCRNIASQIADGDQSIVGVMLESNLKAGSQKLTEGPLEYGVSITDGCIGWQATQQLLRELAESVRKRRLSPVQTLSTRQDPVIQRPPLITAEALHFSTQIAGSL